MEALGDGENPETGARYGAELATLEEIASGLSRDREAVRAKLAQLDAAEDWDIARERALL